MGTIIVKYFAHKKRGIFLLDYPAQHSGYILRNRTAAGVIQYLAYRSTLAVFCLRLGWARKPDTVSSGGSRKNRNNRVICVILEQAYLYTGVKTKRASTQCRSSYNIHETHVICHMLSTVNNRSMQLLN